MKPQVHHVDVEHDADPLPYMQSRGPALSLYFSRPGPEHLHAQLRPVRIIGINFGSVYRDQVNGFNAFGFEVLLFDAYAYAPWAATILSTF